MPIGIQCNDKPRPAKRLMMHTTRLLCATLFLLLASNGYAQPSGSQFLKGKETAMAVVLAHGRGEGPDGKVVGPLRKAIHNELGFTTLSLQMPVLPGRDFRIYAPAFPDAYKTLQTAIDFLTKEQGVTRIYLLGYSMGARMTTSFLATQPHHAVIGFIGVGLLQGGGDPLDANQNLLRVRLPILDVYADNTPLDLRSAENRKSLASGNYTQVRMEGAEHSFQGYDAKLAEAIIAWIRVQEQKRQKR